MLKSAQIWIRPDRSEPHVPEESEFRHGEAQEPQKTPGNSPTRQTQSMHQLQKLRDFTVDSYIKSSLLRRAAIYSTLSTDCRLQGLRISACLHVINETPPYGGVYFVGEREKVPPRYLGTIYP